MWLGVAGTFLITLGSWGAGATRHQGGLLEALGLKFLSFGHGGMLSTAVLWAGVILLVLAWVRQGKYHQHMPARQLLTHTYCWLVPLLAAGPIMSRDVYSYLMQGAMLRDGFDPYTEGVAVNPGPYLLEVSHDWRNTTTPYGPLHLWLGEGITTLVGDNVTLGVLASKVISVLGFVAIAESVPRIARHLGASPSLAVWLGVSNPVMILHLVGGMHNESLMVGMVSLGLLACLQRRFIAGTIIIAAAVALKATAAIALPFVVWMATNHYPHKLRNRAVAFLVTGTVGVALTFATIGLITWASGTSWKWLTEISGNSKIINPLSLPTLATDLTVPFLQLFFPGLTYNQVLGFYRPIGSLLMLVSLVVVWWRFRQNDRRTIAGIVLAYLVAFLFNAVALPWYYASILALVGTFHTNPTITRWTAGLSIFVALAFSGSGNHQLYDLPWVIITALIAWVLAEWVVSPRPQEAGRNLHPTAPPAS